MSAVWRVLVVAGVFALAVYLSHEHGVPKELPGAALGWTWLFHVERATALLAGLGIVLLVGWRALHGEFPIKFGQVEYPAKAVDERTQAAAASQEARIRLLEAAVFGVRPPD